MSTVGKVLTVLVTLAVLGGVFLTAKVANLNSNYGKRIQELSTQVDRLDGEIKGVKDQINANLAQIRLFQEGADNDLVVLRTKVSDMEMVEAEMQEAIERTTLQVKLIEDATRDGKAAEAARKAELAQTQQDLERTRAEVEESKVTVNGLLDTLNKLHSNLMATVAENRRLLKELQGGTTESGSTARVRAASYRRP